MHFGARDRASLEMHLEAAIQQVWRCNWWPWSNDFSKKHFRPGAMAASEWTRSVRAVRDTSVADYSTPGINTTRRVAYRPPIAVSLFLLALKISPHVPSTLSSRIVRRRWEDMNLPGRKDPRNCADPWNLGKSDWNQKLGQIECVFSLYDKMRWKWNAV